jgi:signal transduction histidine kinase
VWTSVYLLRKTLEAKDKNKKVVTYFSVGVICFLLSFSMANIIASITKYWDILHYGLFGMPIFMGFLIYLIVEYRLFNIRVLAARILVISIIVLIASQFFFIQTLINQVLTLITLLLVMAFGWWLIKSVEKEYKQKEELKLANAELKKLDQAKSDFINIASHQLRTPITVIQGVASMLIDGDIDRLPKEERQKFYESVWVKSRKLQTIINDILNATKIDNRVSEMDRVEEVNFCELLTKIVSDFELEAKERDIDLILDLPESPVSTIIGQKKYLEEAFVNLINNAIKYTPSSVMTSDVRKLRWNKARAKVLVTIREEEKEGKILIQVKDNGIGIPKESASSIFKKFSRANNAVEMYTDGSGLGLYIVKEIIEGHGGKIWFDSKVNHGTTFSVELPLKNEKISNVKNRILKEK